MTEKSINVEVNWKNFEIILSKYGLKLELNEKLTGRNYEIVLQCVLQLNYW